MTLRGELIADFRQYGDLGALGTLLAAVPQVLPSAIVRRERDRRLRLIAEPFITRLSVYRAAVIVRELGDAAESGRPPRIGAIPVPDAEVSAARREITRMVQWMPTRRAGGHRWPTTRHLIRILSN
jgi:hypothetical protein